jgi:hypothetical protein
MLLCSVSFIIFPFTHIVHKMNVYVIHIIHNYKTSISLIVKGIKCPPYTSGVLHELQLCLIKFYRNVELFHYFRANAEAVLLLVLVNGVESN